MEKEILKKYIDLIVEWGIAQEEGDSKKSNKIYDKKNKFYHEIKENINLYINDLIISLNNENDYVKSEIAFLLLPYKTEEAKKALEEVSIKRGTVAFTAKMTLKLWNEGKLKFD